MNKKLLQILIFTFFSTNVFSQKKIENLKKASCGLLGDIEKIELNDSTTVFHFHKKVKDSTSFIIPKNIFITTDISATKYFALEPENIEFGKKNFLDAENELDYKIYFQPIDSDTKTVMFLYEKELSGTSKYVYHEKGSIEKPKIVERLSSYIEIQPVNKLTESDNPFTDISFEKAIAKAKEENKKVYLFYTAGWCYWCNFMKKYTLHDEKISASIRSNFVALKINVDSKEGEELSRTYNSKGIPRSYILNADGDILKEHLGYLQRTEFLNFLKVDTAITAKKAVKNENVKIEKVHTLGLRLGIVNNRINNYFNSQSRMGFTADLLYQIDYNGRYQIRPGIGFASKGIKETTVNYFKMPVEFGYSVYKGSIFNLPGAVRFITSPYYALRLNKKDLGLSKSDYGFRLGIAPHIGSRDELELQFYYEHGMKDLFKNINGFQNNSSFGLSFTLSVN